MRSVEVRVEMRKCAGEMESGHRPMIQKVENQKWMVVYLDVIFGEVIFSFALKRLSVFRSRAVDGTIIAET